MVITLIHVCNLHSFNSTIQDDSTYGVFKEERNRSTTFDMLPLCSLKKSLHFLLPY
jgi:hypothetical protein